MSFLKIFRQPFPHNNSWQAALRIAVGFGIFIAGFLFLFRPFGMDTLTRPQLVRGSLVFGLVTFTCILLTNLSLHYFFPRLFSEKRWTTGKQILNVGAVVVLIGFVNYLVAPLLFDIKLNWKDIFRYQGIALSIGIIPITIYTLLAQNRLLHQYKQGAASLQKKLEEKKGLLPNESPETSMREADSEKKKPC